MNVRTLCLSRSAILMGATVGALTACQDAARPSDRGTILRSTSANATAPSPQGRRDSDAIHRRNQYDWVGREHNRILREFKTRLAQPGVLTHRMCDYMVSFVIGVDGVDERATRLTAQTRRELSQSALASTKLCATANAGRLALPISNSRTNAPPTELVLSPEANDLANRVLAAVDLSDNSYALAPQLTPILDAASQLDSVERAVIEAVVSVAQNSFEYWEAELPAMEDRFYSDYHSCLTQAYQAGYTEDSARDACLNGGIAVTEYLPQPPSFRSRELSVVGNVPTPLRECGLGNHYRRLAGSDVSGAITGAVGGARVGGWAGAAAGAVGGAATASLGSFLKSTWEIFWCAM